MILAVLLVAVLPTMLLTHSNMQLAVAQSANQTSSSSSSAASPPPPSPQAMQNTFYAKGVNGILVLDPNAIQGALLLRSILEPSLVGIGA